MNRHPRFSLRTTIPSASALQQQFLNDHVIWSSRKTFLVRQTPWNTIRTDTIGLQKSARVSLSQGHLVIELFHDLFDQQSSLSFGIVDGMVNCYPVNWYVCACARVRVCVRVSERVRVCVYVCERA